MNNQEAIKLKQEFDSCKTESEKWKFIANNQSSEIVVVLDNDDTYGIIRIEEDEEWVDFQFKGYIGNGPGIEALLEAFGIRSERA